MNNPASAREAKIVIERSYRASIQEVWELWTTKAGFESWWGPQGFRVEVEAIEPEVGGALLYEMIADTPEMVEAMKAMGRPSSHPTRSRFTELKLHERLQLTNVIDFIPGVPTYKSEIGVDFRVEGDQVRMTVTLDRLHSDEFTKMQEQGFTSQLTKLDGRFA